MLLKFLTRVVTDSYVFSGVVDMDDEERARQYVNAGYAEVLPQPHKITVMKKDDEQEQVPEEIQAPVYTQENKTTVDYSRLTNNELKAELKRRKIPLKIPGAKKAILISWLLEDDKNGSHSRRT